ncbi:Replication factor-A protein 1, N-terminal,Nucleic acid-binding, OB-fold [Cinara cedri]|uniref:Replication factor-A protein 1, N-terminal,Nucleic acid-binding, OB-fold n=1 Tax=Cinara cedri TaxID=506608 RepID=A0A5E4NBV8_9HEMI|nr:Replication factor-A protein 1, N-terminal,Nucleic acid-binding, OB-fold [Cinara cedri]
MEYENLLTKGALRAIMNNEEVNEPVFQILGLRKITAVGANVKYRLTISDGQHLTSFTMLASQLHSMILSRELNEFAIVKIKHHIISKLTDHSKEKNQFIILKDLVVMVPGNVVSSKIGDPKPIIDNSGHTVANKIYASVNVTPTMQIENLLTKGALRAIMNNEEVNKPVFQVLGIRKITDAGVNSKHRLLISDGQNLNSFAMLVTQLNSMILSGELTEFSIVKIKDHIISNLTYHSEGNKQVIILIDLVVIVPGNVVLSKIGDPKPIVNNSGYMVTNRMSTSVDVPPTTGNDNLLTERSI